MLDCDIPLNKHSKKEKLGCYLDENTPVSPTIDTSIKQKKISVAALLRSAYILQEITGNANIEISLGGMTTVL